MMKMKTLLSMVQDQEEAERKAQAWWAVPIIPFIPHESDGEDSRASFIEILLRVNMEERSGPNNQVKMSVNSSQEVMWKTSSSGGSTWIR